MSDAAALVPEPGLSDREVAMLAFEAGWPSTPSGREQEVRERFGVSLPRYQQELNRLLDEPAALAHDPLVVKRLRRLRAQRRPPRSAERLR